jgi:hypothetical protein
LPPFMVEVVEKEEEEEGVVWGAGWDLLMRFFS